MKYDPNALEVRRILKASSKRRRGAEWGDHWKQRVRALSDNDLTWEIDRILGSPQMGWNRLFVVTLLKELRKRKLLLPTTVMRIEDEARNEAVLRD